MEACDSHSDSEADEVEQGDEIEEEKEKSMEELIRGIEERDQKLQEYLSLLQRVQAEFENYKKRAERERCEYIEQANGQLVMQLLPVIDNFERALTAESSDADTLKKGVSMIYSQMMGILEAEGLSVIKAEGEFDPFYHEAVLTTDGEDDDIIVEELEKGYLFRNKVLRPSKVKITKR